MLAKTYDFKVAIFRCSTLGTFMILHRLSVKTKNIMKPKDEVWEKFLRWIDLTSKSAYCIAKFEQKLPNFEML